MLSYKFHKLAVLFFFLLLFWMGSIALSSRVPLPYPSSFLLLLLTVSNEIFNSVIVFYFLIFCQSLTLDLHCSPDLGKHLYDHYCEHFFPDKPLITVSLTFLFLFFSFFFKFCLLGRKSLINTCLWDLCYFTK